MKKEILIIILILFITGCGNKNNNITIDNYNLNLESKESCTEEVKVYYEDESYKIYTVCLEEINLNKDNKTISFNNYLSNNDVDDTIDKIIKQLKLKESLWDGGTTLYTNKNISVIKCKTIDNNNNIYIGNKDLTINDNYCK